MTYQNLNLILAKTLLLSYILTNAISIKLEKNILYLKNSIYIYTLREKYHIISLSQFFKVCCEILRQYTASETFISIVLRDYDFESSDIFRVLLSFRQFLSKTGSRKHPIDKCRSTCLEQCDITGLTSKRLVKQALNDCWYLEEIDKEKVGKIEGEEQKKRQAKGVQSGPQVPRASRRSRLLN